MAVEKTFTSGMVQPSSEQLVLVDNVAIGNNLQFGKRIWPAHGMLAAVIESTDTVPFTVQIDYVYNIGNSGTRSFSQTVTPIVGDNYINLYLGNIPVNDNGIIALDLVGLGANKTVKTLYAEAWCHKVEE